MRKIAFNLLLTLLSFLATGCALAVGKSDPLVIGIGKARFTTVYARSSEGAPVQYQGKDGAVSTLLFLGYSRPMSGVILGPSSLRTTAAYHLSAPPDGEAGAPKTDHYFPFILHRGSSSVSGSSLLVTRDWVGSVGAKVIQQGGTSSLGIGYQCRMVGSGIADSYPWGYVLYDREPWLELLTADTKSNIE